MSIDRASVILICIICGALLSVEVLTRLVYVELNKGIAQERRERDKVTASSKEKNSVVMAGNSLVQSNIDMDSLAANIGSGLQLIRYAVPDTTYFDWYYGLNRLRREGVVPGTIVLVMTPQQFVSNGVKGEYFARRLMSLEDLFSVAHDIKLNMTDCFSMMVSNVSEFYGLRTEIRKSILHAFLPGLPELSLHFVKRGPWQPDWTEVYNTSYIRLVRLKTLAEAMGARLLVVIPPLLRADGTDGANELERAGIQSKVPILIPIRSGALSPDHFDLDRFHMNEKGAKVFTEALGEKLKAFLVKADT